MTEPVSRRKLTITARTMAKVADSFISKLESRGWDVSVRLPEGQNFSGRELASVVRGAEAVIIGDDEASEYFFGEVCSELKLLIKWGVGTDSIDFQSAARFGVEVRNTPGAFNDEVADLALAYVLALARNVVEVHNSGVAGQWNQKAGTTLAGKTIGIVGFGGIGRAIASRSLAFGLGVVFYDPYFAEVPPEGCWGQTLNEVFTRADFLVLACPSTAETKGIVNSRSLGQMKVGSALINVARGELVVESDLVDALDRGLLSGAALDVYEIEPLPKDSELRKFSNVVLGAHNGSNTLEGLMRASSIAADIVISYGGESSNG